MAKQVYMVSYVIMTLAKLYTALFLLWLVVKFAKLQSSLEVRDDILGRKVPAVVYI